jgi:hypothetical protein
MRTSELIFLPSLRNWSTVHVGSVQGSPVICLQRRRYRQSLKSLLKTPPNGERRVGELGQRNLEGC